jgi:hypothetical protein
MAYAEGRLYWGVSNSYMINVSGLDGKKLGAFEVKRKKTKVSDSFKKKYFADDNIPPDMLKQLVESLPNEISCFHRIDVLEGFVYVYVPIFSPLHNLKIKGENLYVVLTDTDDNVLVSKYSIKLPMGSR